MPISFPTSPTNDQIYTEGTLSWKYSTTSNAWTIQTLSQPGIDNGNNHDNELVYLVNSAGVNAQTASGEGIKWNATNRTLTLKQDASPLSFIVLTDRNGLVLNQFNGRGVLENAGRIYYLPTAPTVNAADTGVLWYNTSSNVLSVWNGSTWDTAAGNVSTLSSQTFAAAQTFGFDVLLENSADIAATGASVSLNLKARDGANAKTNGITVASNQVTVHQPLEFTALTATAKNVVATLADTQTITAEKTFSGGIITESLKGSSNNVVLSSDGTANGRSITLVANATTTSGITLRAINASNQGQLSVVGKSLFNDDVEVLSGKTTYAHSLVGNTVSHGQFRSAGTGVAATQTDPPNLGPLSISAISGSGNSQKITVTNNGTKTVGFYYTRSQMLNSGAYTLGTSYVRMAAGSVVDLAAFGTAVTSVSGSAATDVIHNFGTGISALDTGSGIGIKLEMAGVVTV